MIVFRLFVANITARKFHQFCFEKGKLMHTSFALTALALAVTPALAQSTPAEAAGTAGKDAKGIYMAAGEAKLYFGGFLQSRFSVNSRNDVVDPEQDLTTGFSIRRVRMGMNGDLNKQLGFKIEGDGAPDEFKILDAFGRWTFDGGSKMRFGQFKLPLLKEELVTDTQQQFVEKSNANSTFSQDRSQGIDFQWNDDTLRFTGAFSDGLRTLNTSFDSATEADYALTGRVEYKWAGDWKQFDAFTSFNGSKYAGYVGAAVHWQDGGETGGTTDSNVLEYTLDTMFKGDGWNAFAAFIGRRTETTGTEFDDFGIVAQAGVMATNDVELFGRFSFISPDDDRTNGADFSEATIGATHFILPESHAAKIVADLTWAFDDQAGSSSIVRPSAANAFLAAPDDQVYARVQFQIVF